MGQLYYPIQRITSCRNSPEGEPIFTTESLGDMRVVSSYNIFNWPLSTETVRGEVVFRHNNRGRELPYYVREYDDLGKLIDAYVAYQRLAERGSPTMIKLEEVWYSHIAQQAKPHVLLVPTIKRHHKDYVWTIDNGLEMGLTALHLSDAEALEVKAMLAHLMLRQSLDHDVLFDAAVPGIIRRHTGELEVAVVDIDHCHFVWPPEKVDDDFYDRTQEQYDRLIEEIGKFAPVILQ